MHAALRILAVVCAVGSAVTADRAPARSAGAHDVTQACLNVGADRSVSAERIYATCATAVVLARRDLAAARAANATPAIEGDENGLALLLVYVAGAQLERGRKTEADAALDEAHTLWIKLENTAHTTALQRQALRALRCFYEGEADVCRSLFPRSGA